MLQTHIIIFKYATSLLQSTWRFSPFHTHSWLKNCKRTIKYNYLGKCPKISVSSLLQNTHTEKCFSKILSKGCWYLCIYYIFVVVVFLFNLNIFTLSLWGIGVEFWKTEKGETEFHLFWNKAATWQNPEQVNHCEYLPNAP